MMESLLPEWAIAGYQRERTGHVSNVSPSNVYPTADGDLVLIAANQDSVFKRLVDVMARPELAADKRYSTHSARGPDHDRAGHPDRHLMTTLTAVDLLEKLHAGGVPAGLIFRAKDMFTDPALRRPGGDRPGDAPRTRRTADAERRAPALPHPGGPHPGRSAPRDHRWRTQPGDLAGQLGLRNNEIDYYTNQSVV